MIKELALRKLASDDWYDSEEDDLLKSIDFTDRALELGTLYGGYNLTRKYGTNFGKWGDKHINALLKDKNASKLARWYAENMPKNRLARGIGALVTSASAPVAITYGVGSILNRLKRDKDV